MLRSPLARGTHTTAHGPKRLKYNASRWVLTLTMKVLHQNTVEDASQVTDFQVQESILSQGTGDTPVIMMQDLTFATFATSCERVSDMALALAAENVFTE